MQPPKKASVGWSSAGKNYDVAVSVDPHAASAHGPSLVSAMGQCADRNWINDRRPSPEACTSTSDDSTRWRLPIAPRIALQAMNAHQNTKDEWKVLVCSRDSVVAGEDEQ
ncbi:hypothetical protein PsYK624_131530 [Phanerochaete sordida]|uniref:Uncharacterized protein n=1 Tax=Phanerochaete sordida TaxID=48140 RepID=A0A9P3GMG8_9APHY|nr:hypothetical protein PsYK624_131530 [Phanerochaete sordida]